MAQIAASIVDLIGKTPIMELCNFQKNRNLNVKLLAKLESFNPAGSSKDRIAKAMIEEAEQNGWLQQDSVIIEPTSGNTGIGLAAVGAAKGYKVILTMPDTMSIERRKLLQAYGAKVILTDGALGMNGAIKKAEELVNEIKNAFMPGQFKNPSNPKAHRETTGPEVWEDTEGKIDFFVAGIGTGGTISGTGEYLKSKNPAIQVIGAEPADSPILTKGVSGTHKIQGIGAGFIPETLNTAIYDEIITVESQDAFDITKSLAREEGLLVGISSGAAVYAALTIANRKENQNKRIVILLPDTGERYLSTPMFMED